MKEKIKQALKAKFTGQYTEPTGNKLRSLIILIVGFSVIVFIISFARVNGFNNNNNKNNNTKNDVSNDKELQFLSLDKIFNNYLNNYKYSVTVTESNTTVLYEGLISDTADDGKRTYNNEELEYHIVNDVAIDLKTNKEIPNLYGTYLYSFFKPINIYEFIKDKGYNEEVIDNTKVYNYDTLYNEKRITFKIVITKDSIEQIDYSYEDINYNLKFN